MKTIRRTRITIKERELVIVKRGESGDKNHGICPVCKSHIHVEPAAAANCVPDETPESEKLLMDPD